MLLVLLSDDCSFDEHSLTYVRKKTGSIKVKVAHQVFILFSSRS